MYFYSQQHANNVNAGKIKVVIIRGLKTNDQKVWQTCSMW